jgi:hypothetical protein
MQLIKVRKENEVKFYKVIENMKVEISNNDYLEIELLEGNKTPSNDSDFRSVSNLSGCLFVQKESTQAKKLIKKLKSQIKKEVKKPNHIQKLSKKLIALCQAIDQYEKLISCDYKESVIDFQLELEKMKHSKLKLQKKLIKLLEVKSSQVNMKEYNQFMLHNQYVKMIHRTNIIQQRKEKIDQKIKANSFYPFNEPMTIEQKRYTLRNMGIMI